MNGLGRYTGQQSDQQGELLRVASFSPSIPPYPSAWLGHLPFAAWIIREVEPRVFVELGTHHGHSYFAFCQSVVEAELRTRCFAVDTWVGDSQAGYYGEEVFARVSDHNEKNYRGFSRLLRMPFDDALAHFADGSIDILHIDGLHNYDAVRHEFEMWLPKLAPDAIVIFHDTAVRESGFGVNRLWQELARRYPHHIEFPHSCGLGVLQVSNGLARKGPQWLCPDAPERTTILRYFAALGALQEARFTLEHLRHRSHDLEGEVDQLKAVIAEQEHKLESTGAITEELTAKADEMAVRITSLADALENRAADIRALRASTSWRVTKPLRIAKTSLTKLHHPVSRAVGWVRSYGGIRSALHLVQSVYQDEGLTALLKRVGSVVGGERARTTSSRGANKRNDYEEWVRRYDTLTDEIRGAIRRDIEAFGVRPIISVIMPTYNSNHKWLSAAIASVRHQIYPYWEFCIADDASTDRRVREILQDYAKGDERIKVVFREKNGHISAASNSALRLASGSWVTFLDHDDMMHEAALYWIAKEILSKPEARLIYSDEDKVDSRGGRLNPYWKCDWNKDLFYSHNMVCHLAAYRRDLVTAVGGLREGMEGAQDYDLALRCLERLEPRQIQHVPRVLYHWRQHPASTAQSPQAKPYAMLAGERALNEHFSRRGLSARAEAAEGGYRVRYKIGKPLPLVSLVILTKDRVDLLRQCVSSILTKTEYERYELLIVDNGSTERETFEYLEELGKNTSVRLVKDGAPFNFSALNNRAVALARGDIIGLLNNDTEVISPEWLQEMVSLAVQKDIGAVGARLWYPDDTLQHGGVILGIGGIAGHSHRHARKGDRGFFGRAVLCQSLSAVTAACLVVRKAVYEEVEGLNDRDLAVAFNDVDFCLRVREAGYRNVWTPYANLYHYESASRGPDTHPEKRGRFAREKAYMKRRWRDSLTRDPAYSPNLTLEFEDFSLAWPPRVGGLTQDH